MPGLKVLHKKTQEARYIYCDIYYDIIYCDIILILLLLLLLLLLFIVIFIVILFIYTSIIQITSNIALLKLRSH